MGEEREKMEDPPPPPSDGDASWAARRAELESDARELADELGEAVDDTRHAIRDRVKADAGRLRRVSDLFRQGVVGFLLGLHLGGTAVLTTIVFSESFPYPYMYLVMGLLLWGVFTMRFRALRSGKYGAATRSAVVNVLLTAFWVYVLLDQVKGRPVIVGSLQMRPDVPLIWIAILMYIAAQAGMIAHGVVDRVRRTGNAR